MPNTNDNGFLRGDRVGGLYGPLVTTSLGGTSDALTDTQLRATPVTVAESKSTTATHTNVNDTASSTTLLASNSARKGASIYNDSTVDLYMKLGATASSTSFTYKLVAGAYYEVPFGYTGIIDGIWASDASGAARIVEFT